ncbi:hypothetical protein [Streptomyces sp. NPDC020681]|uniref:hypothetical protein n=1 Tax=Streptomyces sp. NPDC020681 TaxID=3365083 RepID=UPI003799F60D
MPENRALTRPSDAAITAAHQHAHWALACVLSAVGIGTHALNYVARDACGKYAATSATINHPMGTAPLDADPDEVHMLLVALTFGIEGSCVNSAVLVITTQTEAQPRACGWTIQDGWLHPMAVAELRKATTPCPGSDAPAREIYDAPALPEPPAN